MFYEKLCVSVIKLKKGKILTEARRTVNPIRATGRVTERRLKKLMSNQKLIYGPRVQTTFRAM